MNTDIGKLAVASVLGLALLGCENQNERATAKEPATAQEERPATLVRTDKVVADEADNRAPSITDITFRPSKFVRCGETLKICVTATDPDRDTLETEWNVTEGAGLKGDVETLEAAGARGRFHQCAEVEPAPGETQLEVRVIDQRAVPTRPGGQPDKVHLYDSMSFPVRAGGEDC